MVCRLKKRPAVEKDGPLDHDLSFNEVHEAPPPPFPTYSTCSGFLCSLDRIGMDSCDYWSRNVRFSTTLAL